ncbi:hypothetical protein HDU96_011107 [Phlyctochytrium bullatum]|nr:hypothetical protein HDU96_011107 [Phlyctochytrium bullatum]
MVQIPTARVHHRSAMCWAGMREMLRVTASRRPREVHQVMGMETETVTEMVTGMVTGNATVKVTGIQKETVMVVKETVKETEMEVMGEKVTVTVVKETVKETAIELTVTVMATVTDLDRAPWLLKS